MMVDFLSKLGSKSSGGQVWMSKDEGLIILGDQYTLGDKLWIRVILEGWIICDANPKHYVYIGEL